MDSILEQIPEDLAREISALGLRHDGETLWVGLPSSIDDAERETTREQLQNRLGTKINQIPVEDALLQEVLNTIYTARATDEFTPKVVATGESEGPIADLVNEILDRAVRLRASDIHVEPTESELVIRARVDGQLETIVRLPGNLSAPFISRLKVLAKINIVERRRPQDGQFSIVIDDRQIDCRLATVTTLYGEKAVMRLLDTRKALTDLSGLGLAEEQLRKVRKMVHAQHGLVVTAGPTGSGKTTTLHSALHDLDVANLNVSTIEDPVEYVMKGINHIPVVDELGIGFATQLRALLRQDPDVILVGETRDSETARISVQAALSGRLVITSLHATDALATIYRLFQMDIEPYLVAASLRGVIAQRLVRRVCDYCAEAYTPSKEELLTLAGLELPNNFKLRRGHGCSVCRNSGYRDRVGVYQVFEVSDTMREMISRRPDPYDLANLAEKEGLKTLETEAYILAVAGMTTVQEATRLVTKDVH
jgi:type IV pilus assembly protein PilB